MKPSFCAIASQQIGEDLIGTAGHYQTYVLIECPMPWAAKAFNSKCVPPTLRKYIKDIKSKQSVQVLAIDRGLRASAVSSDKMTLMVYERTVPSDVTLSGSEPSIRKPINGYRGYEFQLDDLTQVADCLEAYWQGDRIGQSITQQDILVCTHGMRDKCCARFGQPFFRDASRGAKRGELPNTRVWKVSHIGGHRFAPTAISMPDGRYYGRLTLAILKSVVTRSGPVSQTKAAYRGWGLLPVPLQVLEQQLLLKHGWSWFDHKVSYQILTDSAQEQCEQSAVKTLRELSVEICVLPAAKQSIGQPESRLKESKDAQQTITYRAKLIQDPQKTVCTKASCSSAVAVPVVKYTVADCVQVDAVEATAEITEATAEITETTVEVTEPAEVVSATQKQVLSNRQLRR
ncbi:MAG: sucrase ferredoxin [Phormidesmis sp.]